MLTQGEVKALNEGSLDRLRQAQGSEGVAELGASAAHDGGVQVFEPITGLDLAQLCVQELRADLPLRQTFIFGPDPFPKMSGEGVEVGTQAVSGEQGDVDFRQALPEFMHKTLSIGVGPSSHMNDRDDLGLSFKRDPDKHPLRLPAHLGDQFVQLQVMDKRFRLVAIEWVERTSPATQNEMEWNPENAGRHRARWTGQGACGCG